MLNQTVTSAARTLNFEPFPSTKKVRKSKTEKQTPKITSPEIDLFESSQDKDPIPNISFDSSDDEMIAENKQVESKNIKNTSIENTNMENRNVENTTIENRNVVNTNVASKNVENARWTGIEWLKKLENKGTGTNEI